MSYWFVIINPTSGNNFVKKKKKKVLDLLENLEQPFEVFFTEYSGHEEELVLRGVKTGFRNFISIGGDGTVHHVVNGVMKQNLIPINEITVGVIPVGTGNDWVKNNFVPKDIRQAINTLNNYQTTTLDIGKLSFQNEIRYFNILTGIGYDGYVVDKVTKYKSFGKAAYLIASLIGFAKYKNSVIKYQFNDQEIITESLMAIVGIGKFCGSGMLLTEDVDHCDGLFDISLVKNISVPKLFLNVKKMYNGKLTSLKEIDTYKTNKIKVEIIEGPTPFIESDGELIGQGNFEVEMVEQGLRFVVGSMS